MTKYSVLDLAPIPQGTTPGTALRNSLSLAQSAEDFGYNRYWVAEHHNMTGIASSATSVLIGYLAGGTKTIRVGAGGIMLPNHSPLVIAEHFGTLESLYPGRIDLGIGRAPGTDQLTSRALRRTLSGNIDDFPNDVAELQHYLDDPQANQRVIAVPGAGTHVPIWILGSSLYGAQLAAMMGLPYAFASHFAPEQMAAAIDIYRRTFKPSTHLQSPYVMLGYNVCVADTDEEANFLRSSSLQSFIQLRRGTPIQLPRPVQNFEASMSSEEHTLLASIGRCSAIGSMATVKAKITAFVEQTGADELMLVSSVYDHAKRIESYRLAMQSVQS